MNLILFEDEQVEQLAPLAHSRPAYAIGCGGFRLIDLVGELGCGPARCAVRPHLRAVQQADGRALFAAGDSLEGRTLLVNARLVPSVAALGSLRQLMNSDRDAALFSDGSVAAAWINGRSLATKGNSDGAAIAAALAQLNLSAAGELPLIEYPHDIIRHHLLILRENLEYRARSGFRQLSDGVFVGENVQISPQIVTDTRDGPILLDAGSSHGPFCYLRGPAYVGRGARLIEHAVLKDGVTVGERCKIGGEVEASIIEPLSNKQHHGYLGHSYVGSWVNLGAGTSNSDLKNTYGPVAIDYGGQKVQTGMQLVGCFIGDYAKTAINSSIYTGKTIGVCSMVYGVVTTPVPSFTNYARSLGQVTELPVEVAAAMQARMFARRGIEQRPCDIELLKQMHERTRGERAQYGEPLLTKPPSL